MKKLFKMTMILLILIFGIQFQMNMCYARNPDEDVKEQRKEQSTQWSHEDLDYYKPDPDKEDVSLFNNKVGRILGIIRVIGIVVSVISLMVIGVKTMIGSVEEKSQYKQVLPGYILGAVMVMAITCIPSIIYDLMQKFN